jgi:hypothetical protein
MVGIFTAVAAALLLVGVAWAGSDATSDDTGSSSTQIPPASDVSLPGSQGGDVTGTSLDDRLDSSGRDDNGGTTATTIDDNGGTTATTIDDNGGTTATTIDDNGGSTPTTVDDRTGTTIDDHGGDRDNSGSDDSGGDDHGGDRDNSGSDDSGGDDHGGDRDD